MLPRVLDNDLRAGSAEAKPERKMLVRNAPEVFENFSYSFPFQTGVMTTGHQTISEE